MDGTLDHTPDTPGPPSSPSQARRLVPPEVRDAISRRNPSFGRYITVSELGRGGMGAVFKAWDSDLGRWVALKVMLSGSFAGAEERERFLREAQTGAQFSHANIAAVYEVGVANDQPFIAMQFIEGRTLHELAAKDLTVRRAAELVRDAARAMHYAHDLKVIHRDVKPQNLIVARTGQVYVLDFGLARAVDVKSSLSVTGYAVGTPAYMSPEQARGDRSIDRRTDVYALGATLYYAVTGKRPFEGPTPHSIINAVIQDPPVPPSRRSSHVPPDLEAIILKAMSKRADQRYATAQAFADDVDRFLVGAPIAAKPPSAFARFLYAAAKRRALTASVSVGAAAAIALVIAMTLQSAAAERTQAKLREEQLGREKQMAEDAARRQKADAEASLLAAQIEAWTTVLYAPPQNLAPHIARLRDLLAKLDALDTAAKWRPRGRALELLGRLEEAEESFTKAESWADRGRIRLRRYQALMRAARVHPQREAREREAASMRDLAVADFNRSADTALRVRAVEGRDYDGAVAAARASHDADAWDLAADAALAARKHDDAVEFAGRAARIRESDPDLVLRAAYTNLEKVAGFRTSAVGPNLDEAERLCNAAASLLPDHRDVLALRTRIGLEAQWLAWEGNATAAGGPDVLIRRMKDGLAAGLRIAGRDDVSAAYMVTQLLSKLAMYTLSIYRQDPTTYCEQLIDVSGRLTRECADLNVPSERAYSYITRIEWELQAGRRVDKVREWAAAVAVEADPIPTADAFYYPGVAHYHLASLTRDRADFDRAHELFTKALGRQPDHGPSRRFRAYCRFAMGDFKGCLQDLEGLTDADAERLRAAAHQQLGD
jgi:tetratricopeptide (TPR) repeat protein/predicted Ser/Thr protein kinase